MRFVFRAVVVLFIAGVLAACQNAPKPTSTPVPAPSATASQTAIAVRPTAIPAVNLNATDLETRASLRIINSQQTPFDVQIEGTLAAPSLPFAVVNPALNLDAGEYRVLLTPAGAALSTEKILLEQRISLKAKTVTVAVIAGTAEKPALTLFTGGTGPLKAGITRLILGHTLSGSAVNVMDGSTALTTLDKAGTQDEKQVPAKATTLSFVQGGNKPVTVPLSLAEQQLTFVLAIGDTSNAQAVVITEATEQETSLRVVRVAGKDLSESAVDVYLDKQRVAQALVSGSGTDWQSLTTRQYTLRILTAGDDPEKAKPLFTAQLNPQANQSLDLLLYADRNGVQYQLLPENLQATAAGNARLVVFNASPNANNLIMERSGVQDSTFRSLRYAESSMPLDIPAGPFNVAFRSLDLGTPQTIEINPDLTLDAGNAYLYIVTGAASKPVLFSTKTGTQAAASAQTQDTAIQVRILNNLSDDSVITLKANDQTLIENVPAGTVSKPALMSAQIGKFTVVTSAGASLASLGIAPKVSKSILLIAIGKNGSASLIQQVENSAPTSSVAIAQVIHSAADAGKVRVEFAQIAPTLTPPPSATAPAATPSVFSQVFAEYLDYKGVSGARALSPGNYQFTIRSSQDNRILAKVSDVTIVAGKRYDIVLLAANGTFTARVFVSDDLSSSSSP